MEVALKEVAEEVFGFSDRHYRKLAKEKIVPPVCNGRIDLFSAAKALISYYRGLYESKGDPELKDQKARLERIRADREDLKLQKERADLVSVDLAIKSWGNVCQAIRGRMLSLPHKLAPMVQGCQTVPEAKEIIENYVHEVMKEIANPSLRLGNQAPGGRRSRNAKAPAQAENQ
jgi:phage terminase Nu1 subunit (DNA packaging protein)